MRGFWSRTFISALAVLMVSGLLAGFAFAAADTTHTTPVDKTPKVTLKPRPANEPLSVIVQVEPPRYGAGPAKTQRELLDAARKTLEIRLKPLAGDKDPDIQPYGEDSLIVKLPPRTNPMKATELIESRVTLRIYDLKDVKSPGNPSGKWSLETMVAPSKEVTYMFTGPDKEMVDSIIHPGDVLTKVVDAKHNAPLFTVYDVLSTATADTAKDGGFFVKIELAAGAVKKLSDFSTSHTKTYLAVVLNNKLISAPLIRVPIADGTIQLDGFKTLTDAKQTAALINSAITPGTLHIIGISAQPRRE